MAYRCEAVSVEGFIQQVVSYVTNGYQYYVKGEIPKRVSDPTQVDAALIEKYGLDIKPWTRSRRKAAGHANVAYLRYKRFFILLATGPVRGHRFFNPLRDESENGESEVNAAGSERRIRDAWRGQPVKFAGYSIGRRRASTGRSWHTHVRIDEQTYRSLKAHLVEIAKRRTVAGIERELARIRFTRYYPIRRQLLDILRAMNRERELRGFEPVPVAALKLKRRSVKVYAEEDVGQRAAA